MKQKVRCQYCPLLALGIIIGGLILPLAADSQSEQSLSGRSIATLVPPPPPAEPGELSVGHWQDLRRAKGYVSTSDELIREVQDAAKISEQFVQSSIKLGPVLAKGLQDAWQSAGLPKDIGLEAAKPLGELARAVGVDADIAGMFKEARTFLQNPDLQDAAKKGAAAASSWLCIMHKTTSGTVSWLWTQMNKPPTPPERPGPVVEPDPADYVPISVEQTKPKQLFYTSERRMKTVVAR